MSIRNTAARRTALASAEAVGGNVIPAWNVRVVRSAEQLFTNSRTTLECITMPKNDEACCAVPTKVVCLRECLRNEVATHLANLCERLLVSSVVNSLA